MKVLGSCHPEHGPGTCGKASPPHGSQMLPWKWDRKPRQRYAQTGVSERVKSVSHLSRMRAFWRKAISIPAHYLPQLPKVRTRPRPWWKHIVVPQGENHWVPVTSASLQSSDPKVFSSWAQQNLIFLCVAYVLVFPSLPIELVCPTWKPPWMQTLEIVFDNCSINVEFYFKFINGEGSG